MKTKTISALVVILVAAVMAYVVAADTQCGSQDCYVNATLTIGNSAPTITGVQTGIIVVGTGEQSEIVDMVFNVTDMNGYGDLNDSTAQCIGYKSGETDKTPTNCTAQDQSGNDVTYNCSFTFQYYDTAGSDWKWNCSISDNDNATFNDTVTFTISVLDYIDIDATAFVWAEISAGVNDTEADAALNFDNGGNQDYEAATVTAYNATDGSSNVIPATAFYLNNVTGDAAGIQMADGSPVAITTWFTLPSGNASTEDVFAYADVPAVPVGAYSSTNSWLIDITTS